MLMQVLIALPLQVTLASHRQPARFSRRSKTQYISNDLPLSTYVGKYDDYHICPMSITLRILHLQLSINQYYIKSINTPGISVISRILLLHVFQQRAALQAEVHDTHNDTLN
ncbi:MAG TPA: hypothetical protein VFM18_11360 [Methanosarcina sp.]|nr:hypothetical protein [Methanosarcina sp.]